MQTIITTIIAFLMFAIFSMMFLSTIFVQFPLRVWNILTISDCYQSFTNPPIYLNVTHYFHSGPLYFTAVFYYKRYSILPDYESETEKVDYNFKKIDKLCNSSIIFTTMGEDLKRLHVKIKIYLFDHQARISYIRYNFYKGFNPGNYMLIDINQNFAINIEIPEIEVIYLTDRIRLFNEDTDYVKSISGRNFSQLCIKALKDIVILKPSYRFGIPSGLIYAIEINVIKNITKIKSITYPAFECKMHKKYKKEPIVFITDVKNCEIKYKLLYMKYIDGELYGVRQNFEINYPKYEYVDNLKNISQIYKNIFLINLKYKSKKCPDGSKSIVIILLEGKHFISGIIKIFNISTGVEYKGYFPRKTRNPCDE